MTFGKPQQKIDLDALVSPKVKGWPESLIVEALKDLYDAPVLKDGTAEWVCE